MNENINLYDAAVMIASQRGYVTADDLHGYEREGQDKRVFGMVLRNLVSKKVLYPSGYTKSNRSKCHARPIVLFKMG